MLSFVMVFFCANAEKFAVDNLYYFISADGMSATVSFADDSDNFKNNYAWLSEVVIPETVEHDGKSFTVTAVGENAFRGCTMLEKVALPSTLERIGNLAFYKCSALTEIGVPASVTHIAGTAFGSCAGLESITVDAANIVYDSREDCNAVIETATGTLVAGCKNTVVPASVTAIGNDAFSGHSGLEVINLRPVALCLRGIYINVYSYEKHPHFFKVSCFLPKNAIFLQNVWRLINKVVYLQPNR